MQIPLCKSASATEIFSQVLRWNNLLKKANCLKGVKRDKAMRSLTAQSLANKYTYQCYYEMAELLHVDGHWPRIKDEEQPRINSLCEMAYRVWMDINYWDFISLAASNGLNEVKHA